MVTVDELLVGVDIALGNLAVNACPAFDLNGDGAITVDELLAAVDAALNGCTGRRQPVAGERPSQMHAGSVGLLADSR